MKIIKMVEQDSLICDILKVNFPNIYDANTQELMEAIADIDKDKNPILY